MPNLNNNLRQEYDDLFNTCNINQSKANEVENIIKKIIANKSRYETAGNPLEIPWFFIGVIHNMEASLSFKGHLHNGDPLTARTVQVPAGRPAKGNPPFTWEESATDSLLYKKLDKWKDWTIPGLLYKFEEYNGWGYRNSHPQVLSPYLWSFSNHYTKGKYVGDHEWSDTAVSQQCGAAVLLRRMAEKGHIEIPISVSVPGETSTASASGETLIKYSNKKIEYAAELQQFLNKLPGIFLKEDGKPGDNTSAAVKKVFGFYLDGDARK